MSFRIECPANVQKWPASTGMAMPIWRKLLQGALTSCPAALYMPILDIPRKTTSRIAKKVDQKFILKLRSFGVVEWCQTKK